MWPFDQTLRCTSRRTGATGVNTENREPDTALCIKNAGLFH